MAIQSQGCLFYWSSNTTPSTNNPVGEVKTFSGPSGSAAIIDVTHLGSVAKDKLVGLRDEGQVTFECNLMTSAVTGQQMMRVDRAARTIKCASIVLTDASTSRLDFQAYCTGFSISGGVDDVVKSSITLEIAGAVTWGTA
jgi:hypothetical protein